MKRAQGLALAILVLATGAAGAAPRLMTWPDLMSRPLPRPSERIAYGPGTNQFGELWLPSAPARGLVMMIHGGCWRAGVAKLTIMNYAAEDLRRRGLAVWNVEYRGVDQPGGGYPGTFLDVAAAADALPSIAAAHHLPNSRIVVVGHSAGGHLALWLASRRRLPASSAVASAHPLRVAAVVSTGGVPDLKLDKSATGAACGPEVIDALTGSPDPKRPDVYADTSPAERLPLGVRQAIVIGSDDPIAPPWLGRAWADKAKAVGDPVQLTVVRDAGHVELIAPGTDAWAREAAIIERLAR